VAHLLGILVMQRSVMSGIKDGADTRERHHGHLLEWDKVDGGRSSKTTLSRKRKTLGSCDHRSGPL